MFHHCYDASSVSQLTKSKNLLSRTPVILFFLNPSSSHIYLSNFCPTSHYDTIHWSLDPIRKYLQTSCQNKSGVRKTYGEIGMLLIVNKFNVCFTLDPRPGLSERPCFFSPYITLVNPLGFNHTTLGVPTYTLFSKHACMHTGTECNFREKCSNTDQTSADRTVGVYITPGLKYSVGNSFMCAVENNLK